MIQRGDPSISKKKLSLILLKIGVNDHETISNSYFNFHPNRRQKIFSDPKGGPFYVKKIFVSDFARILYVISQGHKDEKFWVSSKLESKSFFRSIGGTLLFQRFFLSMILLKICVSDPETLSILNFNFHPKGGPFCVKKIFVSDFNEIQNLKSLRP